MSVAGNVARAPAKEEPPRDKLDRDYLDACKAAGIEPELARKKQLSLNVVIPVVDRGRRVHGAPLVDEKGDGENEPIDCATEEPEQPDDETERAVKVAGEVLDRKLVRFLIQGKRGARIAARLAALSIWARRIRPKDISQHFDEEEVTPARLRLATAELQELLEADEKGGAS